MITEKGEFDILFDQVKSIYEFFDIKGLIFNILWNGNGYMEVLFIFRNTEKYKNKKAYQAIITDEEPRNLATLDSVKKHLIKYLNENDETVYHDGREMTKEEFKDLEKKGHFFKRVNK